MAAPTIFRKAALERLSTPEQLDQVIEITDSKSWLGGLVIGLAIALACLWGWFGSISKKVEGQGILLRPGGVQTVMAPIMGTLSAFTVNVGDRIEREQIIAVVEERVQPVSPRVREQIHSPASGRVLEILVNAGATIGAGTPLLVIEQEEGGLEALTYVPAGPGKRIRPGMEVQVSPAMVKREEYGYIRGRVQEVSNVAVTKEGMMRTVGNDVVVDGILKNGPVLAVKVALDTSADTPTGFRWSSSKGPEMQLTSGTLCNTQFIVERKRPISLVIPKLREVTGAH